MAVFVTGATGYIGAHVAANLLERGQNLNLLVRAPTQEEAEGRLWRALQLHFDFDPFFAHLRQRIRIFRGDLAAPGFGMPAEEYQRLVQTTESIVHCAASLNRKSERACLNVNLRGTLEVIQLALRAHARHGLRRFSHVSTVAVAGERADEVVGEAEAIDWNRSDYDPYARTKKFCEHMLRELLPADVGLLLFRPSIVLGDSRRGETTQFDMVRAFVFLAGLPFLPFRPDHRLDIVPVEFVAEGISTLHLADKPRWDTFHLASGRASQTFRDITTAIARARGTVPPLYAPRCGRAFDWMVARVAGRRGTAAGRAASLLQVFLPYLRYNTVFDNTRITTELGHAPAVFSAYCYPLLRFATEHRFQYPYRDWPSGRAGAPKPDPSRPAPRPVAGVVL